MADEFGTVIWASARGLRCVLIPFFGSVQLRLLRNVEVVRTEVFVSEARALSASRKWRNLYARRPRRTHLA